MSSRLLIFLVAIGMLLQTGISHADAIDGDWCQLDGKHMTIRGPAIVTPGGQQTSGNYTRHFFSYVIPSGETGEGAAVDQHRTGLAARWLSLQSSRSSDGRW